jgi:lambda family phage portal protein
MIYDAITRIIAKSIALFAPEYATRYLKNHNTVRAYAAASTTGATKNFRPRQSSGAQEIASSWQAVTNKTRALQRDDSHVAGMGRRFVAGLVGEGSWPRPKILKRNPADKYDFEVVANNELLQRWELWAPEACANGDSIYQLQRIAASHFFFDGGLLIRRVVIGGNLALEPIELDQLDVGKNVDDGKTRIVAGKELDQYNKPIAYWIKPRHPAEVGTDSVRIAAKDIIDLFDRDRASSVGGISRLAPCVLNFHNIGAFRRDTMNLARVATGFGVFVETESPDDFFPTDGEKNENDVDLEFVTSGGIHYLRPGEKIQTVKPENPGTTYEPFLRSELRSASVGAGMSYESVSNDGSQTNFSGARQMLLFERALLRYTFAIFEEKFYSRVYRWFVDHEVDFKKLRLANYENDKARYLRCSWSRPKTEWVDPLKDAKAAKEEIDMGVNSLTEYCETQGRDIEEVVATKKYEQKLFQAAGITLGQPPAVAPASAAEVTEGGTDAK